MSAPLRVSGGVLLSVGLLADMGFSLSVVLCRLHREGPERKPRSVRTGGGFWKLVCCCYVPIRDGAWRPTPTTTRTTDTLMASTARKAGARAVSVQRFMVGVGSV